MALKIYFCKKQYPLKSKQTIRGVKNVSRLIYLILLLGSDEFPVFKLLRNPERLNHHKLEQFKLFKKNKSLKQKMHVNLKP